MKFKLIYSGFKNNGLVCCFVSNLRKEIKFFNSIYMKEMG